MSTNKFSECLIVPLLSYNCSCCFLSFVLCFQLNCTSLPFCISSGKLVLVVFIKNRSFCFKTILSFDLSPEIRWCHDCSIFHLLVRSLCVKIVNPFGKPGGGASILPLFADDICEMLYSSSPDLNNLFKPDFFFYKYARYFWVLIYLQGKGK